MFGTGYIQVLYLGRAPRTKETLPDFRKKCRVTRHSRVFRGLTGSQRTPGDRGVTIVQPKGHIDSMEISLQKNKKSSKIKVNDELRIDSKYNENRTQFIHINAKCIFFYTKLMKTCTLPLLR